MTDSELILTQLAAEGYATSKTYDGADLVIVNTCGFIDDAVKESLDAIGDALAANGKVIVTGCLGAKGDVVRETHPNVLAVTGPHATHEVMDAVHRHVPRPHDPFTDLVPAQGIKLTPRHYAYLKISEGCNHRCTFCIIPSMRGDLVSRPIGDVLAEAQRLFDAGVKELLVISQDTSAYGVDVRYRTGFWNGQPLKTRMFDLVDALGRLAEPYGAWVRLHYVYPYPHVDELLPLMASGRVLPYLDVPFQHSHPDVLRRMKRPASGERNLERIAAWRAACPQLVVRSTFIAGFPGETEAEFEHLLQFIEEAEVDRAGCFAYSPVNGAAANALPGMLPRRCATNGARASCRRPSGSRPSGSSAGSARRCRCWSITRRRSAARVASAAAMPTRPRSTAACAAAAGEGVTHLEGGRVRSRAHRRHRGPRPGRRGAVKDAGPRRSRPLGGTGRSRRGLNDRHRPAPRRSLPLARPPQAVGRDDQALPTRLIHHPYRAPGIDAVPVGVHKASTVLFRDTAALRARDWKSKAGYTYGLHGTPTTFTLEERIATLEGGRHTLLAPSGLAAIVMVNVALLKTGDEVRCPTTCTGRRRCCAQPSWRRGASAIASTTRSMPRRWRMRSRRRRSWSGSKRPGR